MEVVSFEIAKKLKEKGFKEKTFGFYLLPIKLPQYPLTYITKNYNKEDDFYSAPTISQVLKWLRDEKFISVEPCATPYNCWYYMIKYEGVIKVTYTNDECKSYELAAIAGIKYVIDNLI